VLTNTGAAVLAHLIASLPTSLSSSAASMSAVLYVSAHGDTNEKAMTAVDLERPLAAQLDPAVNWLVLRRRAPRKGIMSSLRSVTRRNTISFLESSAERSNAADDANSSTASQSTSLSASSSAVPTGSGGAASTAMAAAAAAAEPQFGRPLEQVMARVGGLPAVVRRCVAYIEQHGLTTEGIYRMSGSAAKIAELKQMVDAGGDLWFSASSAIHDVTGLLKLYLRELPDGVVTSRLYPYFISAAQCKEAGEPQFAFLRAAVMALPKYNLMLLEFLMRHLARVSTCTETKMHVQNLATVFAPSVMRAEEMRVSTHSGLAHQATVMLIESVGEAFNLRKSVPFCAAGLAEHAYAPPSEDADTQLLFDAFDVIYFTARPEGDDWWPAVTADGRRGLVPKNYVRVEIDFDQIEGQSVAAAATTPQTPRAVEDSEALRVAVAQRAERDALRSELKSAAPGIAVVRNAASKTTGADDAMTKILELQDRQAALLVQRKEASTAAARIVQLQQAHQGAVVARRDSAKLSESNSDRGSGRESDDGGLSPAPAPRKVTRKNSLQSAAAIVRTLIGGSPLAASAEGGLERSSSSSSSSKKKSRGDMDTSPARLVRSSSSNTSMTSETHSPLVTARSIDSDEPPADAPPPAPAATGNVATPPAPTSPPPSQFSPRGAALVKMRSPEDSPASSPRRRKKSKKKPLPEATSSVSPRKNDSNESVDALAAALVEAEERSVVDSALSQAEDELRALRAREAPQEEVSTIVEKSEAAVEEEPQPVTVVAGASE
jgi:hypothetical protein